MDDDRHDIAKKLRDDINKVIDDIHDMPLHYNSHEEVVVEVLNVLMDFHQERAAFFRTDVQGMASMVHDAREKIRLEEKSAQYDAKQPAAVSGPDIKDIDDELQVLEYIELNKRQLTDEEYSRQQELIADRTAIEIRCAKLRDRQREERAELERKQQEEIETLTPSSELHMRHFHERIDQRMRFEGERQRYIKDYYAAKELTKDMEENEKKKALEPDSEKKLLH